MYSDQSGNNALLSLRLQGSQFREVTMFLIPKVAMLSGQSSDNGLDLHKLYFLILSRCQWS